MPKTTPRCASIGITGSELRQPADELVFAAGRGGTAPRRHAAAMTMHGAGRGRARREALPLAHSGIFDQRVIAGSAGNRQAMNRFSGAHEDTGIRKFAVVAIVAVSQPNSGLVTGLKQPWPGSRGQGAIDPKLPSSACH